MLPVLRIAALTIVAVLAMQVPASADELLATKVRSAEKAQWRDCDDRLFAEGARAVATRTVESPAAGIAWARLRGGRADWDLAIFERKSGRLVASSAGPRSEELAEGFTRGGTLVVQACLLDGGRRRAPQLRVGYIDTRGEAGGPIQLVRVSTPTPQDKHRLTTTGLDLTEHGGPGFVEAVLYDQQDAAALRAAGFKWSVRIADLRTLELRNGRRNRAYAAATARSGLPSGRDTYRRLADYDLEMKELARANPNLVKLITLPHKSLEGRDVLGIEITQNVNVDDGKPVFLQMGVHHAREWPSSEHAMEWAYEVVNGFNDDDPRMRPLAEAVRTIVVPVVNPDGFNLSREAVADLRPLSDLHTLGTTVAVAADPGFAYKRRNCRVADGEEPAPGECGDRLNRDLGVDPNRNYGGLWGGPGASTDPGYDTYRGATPFSEPETQNIRELVSQEQVTTLITNHTFSNLVLRPPGVRAQGPPPDEEIYRALGARMAAQNGYTNQKGYELYDTTGTTEDWTYPATGGLGFTFEIGPDEFHPPFEEVVGEWEGTRGFEGKGNREAYYIAMESAADNAMHSVIEGSAPAGSTIRLQKTFMTSTHDPTYADVPTSEPADEGGPPTLFEDNLDTTMLVPGSGEFEFHTNPSTRPAVEERTWVKLAEEPSRVEEFSNSVPTVPGGGDQSQPIYYQEFEFTVTEADDRAGLEASIDGGAVDDYDIYLFRVLEGGARQAMGSSASATADEKVIVENVEPGPYVLRVVNWLAATPAYTGRWATFATGETEFRAATDEYWTLTCERPGGKVIGPQKVFVERGERASVAGACRGKPQKKR